MHNRIELTTVTVWQFHERLANDCKRR